MFTTFLTFKKKFIVTFAVGLLLNIVLQVAFCGVGRDDLIYKAA